jgi:hypothetical protein
MLTRASLTLVFAVAAGVAALAGATLLAHRGADSIATTLRNVAVIMGVVLLV